MLGGAALTHRPHAFAGVSAPPVPEVGRTKRFCRAQRKARLRQNWASSVSDAADRPRAAGSRLRPYELALNFQSPIMTEKLTADISRA